MKLLTITIALILFSWTTIQAQFDETVNKIPVKIGEIKTIAGDISKGGFIDARFGVRASVGCYGEQDKTKYNGNHVFYAFEVPAGTKILIDLSSAVDLSLYGYMIDSKRYDIPPYLENVSKFGCKASHNPDTGNERILLAAGSVPMNVVIGVAGVNESENGEFKLKITTKK